MPFYEIIKGKHSLKEAISAESSIDRIVIDFKAQKDKTIQNIIFSAKKNNIKIQIIPTKSFVKIAPENSQGIIAYKIPTKFFNIEKLLENPMLFPFCIALDHIQDPYNFGAIIRSAEKMGASAVIYPKDRNAQITSGVIKASSGAIEYMKLIKVTNLSQSIIKLQKAGYWIYGASSKNGESLEKLNLQLPAILILGNEDKGLSQNIISKLDVKINIPLTGKVDSLNVSVAMGIIAYQFYRALKKL